LHNVRFDFTTVKQLASPSFTRIKDIKTAVSTIMEDPETVAPKFKNVPEGIVKEWEFELGIESQLQHIIYQLSR